MRLSRRHELLDELSNDELWTRPIASVASGVASNHRTRNISETPSQAIRAQETQGGPPVVDTSSVNASSNPRVNNNTNDPANVNANAQRQPSDPPSESLSATFWYDDASDDPWM